MTAPTLSQVDAALGADLLGDGDVVDPEENVVDSAFPGGGYHLQT